PERASRLPASSWPFSRSRTRRSPGLTRPSPRRGRGPPRRRGGAGDETPLRRFPSSSAARSGSRWGRGETWPLGEGKARRRYGAFSSGAGGRGLSGPDGGEDIVVPVSSVRPDRKDPRARGRESVVVPDERRESRLGRRIRHADVRGEAPAVRRARVERVEVDVVRIQSLVLEDDANEPVRVRGDPREELVRARVVVVHLRGPGPAGASVLRGGHPHIGV